MIIDPAVWNLDILVSILLDFKHLGRPDRISFPAECEAVLRRIFDFLPAVRDAKDQLGLDWYAPRITYALAEQGDFPSFLGAVHAKYRTPYLSILLYSLLVFFFALAGNFEWNALLSAVSRLAVYVAMTSSSSTVTFPSRSRS